MFVTQSNTYYESDGSQHASRAWYLVLATLDSEPAPRCTNCTGLTLSDGSPAPSGHDATGQVCQVCDGRTIVGDIPLYGAVRKVALSQFGHFMMGTARIGHTSVTVSGAFGSDGLPKHMGPDSWHTISDTLLPHFQRLPDAVAASYWHSGEDYHAGKSGDYSKVKAWALARVAEQKAKALPRRALSCPLGKETYGRLVYGFRENVAR